MREFSVYDTLDVLDDLKDTCSLVGVIEQSAVESEFIILGV